MELPQTLIDAVHYFSDRERCEELLRNYRCFCHDHAGPGPVGSS